MRKNIDELFDQFLQEWEFTRKTEHETLRGYIQGFRVFRALVPDVTLETINVQTVTYFFKMLEQRKRTIGNGKYKQGIKKSTARTYWSKLHTFFDWLYVHRHISENPFRFMRRPTVVWDDVKFLSKRQVEQIFGVLHNPETANPHLYKRNLAIFHVLLFCGLRREELVLLQIRDINFDRKTLTVRAETSKIPRTRHIPLHASVILHLKEYLNERRDKQSPYIFLTSGRDEGISLAGLSSIAKTLSKRSGVPFHLHQFRHTFSVNFLSTSNNVVKLKQLLGHTDIRMTMVYLRCLPTHALRADVQNMRIDTFV